MQSVLQATRNAMVCTPCASCGSTNFELDPVNFDQMCSDCGLIVEQSLMVNIDVQKTASGELEKLGTITNIRDSRVQWDKNEINDAPILEMTNNTEKREYAFKKRLQYVVSGLHEDSEHFNHAINGALRIWRLCYEQRQTRGYDRDQLAAILFYMACRQLKPPLPYLLIDLAAIIRVNVFKLAKKFGKLCKDIPIEIETLSDPSLYISRYVNMLEFGDKTNVVTDTATKVVLQMKKDWITTGRRPAGVCGAAIFIAARIHGFIRTETEIVNVVGLSEGTLRKRIKEFLDTKSCQQLKVKDFVDTSIDAIKQTAHLCHEHDEAPPVIKEQQRKAEKMKTLKQVEEKRLKRIADYDDQLGTKTQHANVDDEDEEEDEHDEDEHKTDDDDLSDNCPTTTAGCEEVDGDAGGNEDEDDEDIDVLLGIKKEELQSHRTVFVRATEADDSLQSQQSRRRVNIGKQEMDAPDEEDDACASTNTGINTNTNTTLTTDGNSSVCTANPAAYLITNANAVQMDDYEHAQLADDEEHGEYRCDEGEEDDDLDEQQLLRYHEENDLSYLDDDPTVQNMLLSEREVVAKTKLFQAINPDWHVVKQRMDEREMVKQEKQEIRDKKRKLSEALKNDPHSQYSSLVDRVHKRFKGFIKNEVNIEAYFKLTGQSFDGAAAAAQPKANSASVNIKKCDPMSDFSDTNTGSYSLSYINADLFACPSDSAICCCVAQDFSMEKGILKQLKTQFNGAKELETQKRNIGECSVLHREQRFVYYLITKQIYSDRTDFEVLETALLSMKEHALEHGVEQICMPYIACGADTDDTQWERVESIIKNVYHDSDIGIAVYYL